MLDEKKKLWPGDVGYPGGISHATVIINGQTKDVRTERDAYGDIVSIIATDKIFGIF